MSMRRMFAAVRHSFHVLASLSFCLPQFAFSKQMRRLFLIEFLQLNHRKGLHRDLSDTELVAVWSIFAKPEFCLYPRMTSLLDLTPIWEHNSTICFRSLFKLKALKVDT
jgi:hypothetical protein